MPQPPRPPIDAVVLDLGGIVFQVDWPGAMAVLTAAGAALPPDLPAQVGAWEPYLRYEVGGMESEDFFAAFQARYTPQLGRAQVAQAWAAIAGKPLPGALPLLAELAPRVPLYAFSNTNAGHLPHLRGALGTPGPFRRIVASNELGQRKPHPAAFHAVAALLRLEPGRTLFVDDTPANVEGARQAGWHAEQSVNDTGRLRAILRNYGVL